MFVLSGAVLCGVVSMFNVMISMLHKTTKDYEIECRIVSFDPMCMQLCVEYPSDLAHYNTSMPSPYTKYGSWTKGKYTPKH